MASDSSIFFGLDMLRRWLKPSDPPSTTPCSDPLASVVPGGTQQVYSVSRSVLLPRVALRAPGGPGSGNGATVGGPSGPGGGAQQGQSPAQGGGINPIFSNDLSLSTLKPPVKHPPVSIHTLNETKPASSGYGSHGGSSHDPTYLDAVAVLEQNAQFVKQILVAVQNKNKSRRSVGSLGSSAGTLTTIPEGKVDLIPKPVWPKENLYDSLVDESLLLYTSLSYVPEKNNNKTSANDILKDLSETINNAIEGRGGLSPEQVLKCISDRLLTGLEVLQKSTEEDMRKLSVNISNSEHLNTVIRAFSNSSSSGNSSQSSKCSALETEDIYQVPSTITPLPVFIHEDLSSVATGMRNALIYGTLLRSSAATASSSEKLLGDASAPGVLQVQKQTGKLLQAKPGEKESVWEVYRREKEGEYYQMGRPEADFTLDVPKSELLSRKMRAAKKWRFRCRIVTSFLGLVFFLLSLMAVSLMLTRGKRMFGSMV